MRAAGRLRVVAAATAMSTPPPPSARVPRGAPRATPADALKWVAACNAPAADLAPFVPWRVAGTDVGLIHPSLVPRLAEFDDVFDTAAATAPADPHIALAPALSTPAARTAALARVMAALRDAGVVTGWRDEPYPVTPAFGAPPLCTVERAAAPLLGVRAYGVHVNGYVVDGDGGDADAQPPPSALRLWVATRSPTKPTWPGRLDHIVAGGQPDGISPADNVVKECGEEAGVPEGVARAHARPAGAVSYAALLPAAGSTPPCVKRDVLFVYDLRLPADFVPAPCDGEVAGFELLPLDDVAALVAHTHEFKDNCNLVIADFLIRHGYWAPEDGAGYLALVDGVRRGALV